MQKPPLNRSHWVFLGDALELNSLRCTCVVRPYHSGAAQAWKLELLYMDGTTDPVTDHLWNPCKRLLCQVSRALINIAFLEDLWFSQFTHLVLRKGHRTDSRAHEKRLQALPNAPLAVHLDESLLDCPGDPLRDPSNVI